MGSGTSDSRFGGSVGRGPQAVEFRPSPASSGLAWPNQYGSEPAICPRRPPIRLTLGLEINVAYYWRLAARYGQRAPTAVTGTVVGSYGYVIGAFDERDVAGGPAVCAIGWGFATRILSAAVPLTLILGAVVMVKLPAGATSVSDGGTVSMPGGVGDVGDVGAAGVGFGVGGGVGAPGVDGFAGVGAGGVEGAPGVAVLAAYRV